MQKPVRLALVALLLVAAGGAGVLAWDTNRRTRSLDGRAQEVEHQFQQLIGLVGAIVEAQQAYLAPGQPRQEWFARGSMLVRQLYADTAGLSALAQSAEAAGTLQAMSDAMAALVLADSRAREHLRAGQPLMAADLVFGDARQHADAVARHVRTLQMAEVSALQGTRATLVQQVQIAATVVAVLWTIGLIALGRTRAPAVPVPVTVPAEPSEPAADLLLTPPSQSPPSVDLSIVADVCTAICRLGSPAPLQQLLARAAESVHATGLVIWMHAGETLLPVAAHGYDADMLARVGPIEHDSDNIAAAAWRTGGLQTLAGVGALSGAIAAPMFDSSRCIGVVTVEVPGGLQSDRNRCAATVLIAAQLAAALGGETAIPDDRSIGPLSAHASA